MLRIKIRPDTILKLFSIEILKKQRFSIINGGELAGHAVQARLAHFVPLLHCIECCNYGVVPCAFINLVNPERGTGRIES